MSVRKKVKVSKRGQQGVVAYLEVPENLEDKRWETICENPASQNAAAIRSIVSGAQNGARDLLDPEAEDGGLEAIQAFFDTYVYGARAPRKVAPAATFSSKQLKALKFSPEQLAALAEQNVQLGDVAEAA